MLNTPKLKLALIAAGVLAFSFAGGAWADEILAYGQTSGSNTVTGTENGTNTQTTVSFTDVAVEVTEYAGPGALFAALMDFTGTSTNAATNVGGVGGTDSQNYSGTFCISQLAGCTGTIYLDGSYIDTLSGKDGGSSLTFDASTPPPTDVLFASTVLSARAIGSRPCHCTLIYQLAAVLSRLSALRLLPSQRANPGTFRPTSTQPFRNPRRSVYSAWRWSGLASRGGASKAERIYLSKNPVRVAGFFFARVPSRRRRKPVRSVIGTRCCRARPGRQGEGTTGGPLTASSDRHAALRSRTTAVACPLADPDSNIRNILQFLC